MDVSGGGTEGGWVVGGGAEWRMTQSWSLSFEYLRFSIDDVDGDRLGHLPARALSRASRTTSISTSSNSA